MRAKRIYLPPESFVVRLAPLIADNTYGNDEGLIGLGSGELDAGMGQAKGWSDDEEEDLSIDLWDDTE